MKKKKIEVEIECYTTIDGDNACVSTCQFCWPVQFGCYCRLPINGKKSRIELRGGVANLYNKRSDECLKEFGK